MKKAFDRLDQCATHLKAIEDFFIANVPEYARNETMLENLGRYYQEFARELYAGGRKEGSRKVGNRYHRGMILADLLTYTVFGRGYYIITASDTHRKAFVEIVMRIANKLLLQENISTDIELRKNLLNTLASSGMPNFFEDEEQKERFVRLRDYDGPIIWGKEGQEFYKTMDAFLPKSRGLAIELLIYLYLIHLDFGFVIPLLLQQRLFTNKRHIAPPDFLVIKPDGRIFGIEVGFWKEGQSTEFVTTTSIPTVAAELDYDQPFRCPKCQQWITYCDRIIETYSRGISTLEPVSCLQCESFAEGSCQNIIFFGEVAEIARGKRRYHYRCVLGTELVKRLTSENHLEDYLKVWYPTASIIDKLAVEE